METYDSLNDILIDISKYGYEKFIIITGGIGDFLTIDYFNFFSNTYNIIFITTQSIHLKNLMKLYYLKNNYYALYFDFLLLKKPGFDKSQELLKYFPQFKNINIINICDIFPIIREKLNKNNFINFVNNSNIFNIFDLNIKSRFNLPEKYAVICPYTQDNKIHCINCNTKHRKINNCNLTRNFIEKDYINILEFLKKNNIIGVIISIEKINIIEKYKDIVVNLSSQLSLFDCIEIVKQSNYFFGIDSFLSVLASKLLDNDKIFIKCNNLHAYNFKDIYWYPNNNINLQKFINI